MGTEEIKAVIEDKYQITVITENKEEMFDLRHTPDPKTVYVQEVKRKLLSSLELKVVVDNLYNTADLLYVAYNALEGTEAKGLLSGLQVDLGELCGDSQVAMTEINNNTGNMLKILPMVYTLLVKGKAKEALKILANGSLYAGKMADAAEMLAQKVDSMIKKATNALLKSEDLYASDVKLKKEMVQKIKEMEIDKDVLEQKAKEMENLVEEIQTEYLDAKKKEEKAEKRAFTMSIISSVTGIFNMGIGEAISSIGKGDESQTTTPEEEDKRKKEKQEYEDKIKELKNSIKENQKKQKEETLTEEEKAVLKTEESELQSELKELTDTSKTAWMNAAGKISGEISSSAKNAQGQAQAAAEKAADTALALQKKKFEMQKDQIELKGNLKKLAEQVKNQKEEAVTLDTAVKMLQLALQCLGNIVSALQATAIFWRGIESGCQSLASDTILTTVDALQDLDAENQAEMYLEDSFMGQMLSYMSTWVALNVISSEYGAAATEAGQTVRFNISHPKFEKDAYSTAKRLADDILSRME